MEKNLILTDEVAANSTQMTEYSAPILLSQKWKLHKFGACDINLGDNKSTVYVLRFGTEIIRILSLTGATQEIKLENELVGDGIKKINVIRINKSGYSKECPCWIVAHKMI